MSARTGFLPRIARGDTIQVGDVVCQRLGLHANEPHALWTVTRVTASSVYLCGITRGRGPAKRGRTFRFGVGRAASQLAIVRKGPAVNAA